MAWALLSCGAGPAWAQETVDVAAPSAGYAAIEASPGAAALDVADVLDTLPGVSIRRLGGAGAWAGVSIRGASMRQVQVFLDGVPLNPDGSDAVNLAELPLGLVERVSVWRALPPPRFVAAPIGGVVEVATRAPSEGLAGRWSLTAGSLGLARVAGVVSGGSARASGLGGVDATLSDGRFLFLDDGGTRFVDDDDVERVRANAGLRQLAGLARARVTVGGVDLTVLDQVSLRSEGFPGPVGAPAVETSLTTRRNVLGLSARVWRSRWDSELRLWRVDRGQVTDDPAFELGIGAEERRDRSAATGVVASAAAHVGARARMTAMAHGRHEALWRSTDDARFTRGAVGGSLDLQAWFGPVRLWPVLDARAIVADGRLTGALLPRLAVQVEAGAGVTVEGAAGMTWRAPDLTELYGSRGAVRGNEQLRPEDGWMVELGVAARRPGLGWFDLRGFWSEADDLIVWVQNAQRSLVPVNVGHARTAGVELAAGLTAGPATFSAQLSAQDARNRSSDPTYRGKVLPAVPSVSADLSGEVRVVRQLRLGAAGEVVDGLFQDATNRYRVPVRATADAWVTTAVTPRLALTIGARNLADNRVATVPIDPLRPESGEMDTPLTDVAGWPLPGRTFFATLTWEAP
jgi:outer membrane cobalamin receptor